MTPSEGPLVSIIIAVYNGAATLAACLDSIIAQNYPCKEIVIRDGGSQDGTLAIIQQYAPYIQTWASAPDRGIYDAWNAALTQARGEWVSFLGCDDRYAHPEALAHMLSVACSRPGLEFVSAQANMLDEHGDVWRVKGVAWDWSNLKVKRRSSIVHTSSLHSRALLERVGPFDPSFRVAGDYDFLLRAGPQLQAAFLPEVVIHRGGSGVSQQAALHAYREAYRAQRNCRYVNSWEARLNLALGLLKFGGGQAWRRLRTRPSGQTAADRSERSNESMGE